MPVALPVVEPPGGADQHQPAPTADVEDGLVALPRHEVEQTLAGAELADLARVHHPGAVAAKPTPHASPILESGMPAGAPDQRPAAAVAHTRSPAPPARNRLRTTPGASSP